MQRLTSTGCLHRRDAYEVASTVAERQAGHGGVSAAYLSRWSRGRAKVTVKVTGKARPERGPERAAAAEVARRPAQMLNTLSALLRQHVTSSDMLDECAAHTLDHATGYRANTLNGAPASGTTARGTPAVREPVLGRALLLPQLRSCTSMGCHVAKVKAVLKQGNQMS